MIDIHIKQQEKKDCLIYMLELPDGQRYVGFTMKEGGDNWQEEVITTLIYNKRSDGMIRSALEEHGRKSAILTDLERCSQRNRYSCRDKWIQELGTDKELNQIIDLSIARKDIMVQQMYVIGKDGKYRKKQAIRYRHRNIYGDPITRMEEFDYYDQPYSNRDRSNLPETP